MVSDGAETAELRSKMVRFALNQLGDAHVAEDVVQEAFVGAVKNRESFAGMSAYSTWVFAILRHKIADHVRGQQRRRETLTSFHGTDDSTPSVFDGRGHWRRDERPSGWGNPTHSAESGAFWAVVSACLDNLPGHQARVFMMREVIGLTSAEILAETGMTQSNLHVTLHRARLKLRRCLDASWFTAEEAAS